jgi:hypothetical protein
MTQKTQKEITAFFKAKQEQLETLQPRSQMILNDEPLWPTGKEIEEYDPFKKFKTRSELLKELNAELKGWEIELQKYQKKLPDFRKVKKNDMHYGECSARCIMLEDMIQMIKDLEDLK